MHVLITRPEQDAAELKASVEALGCQVTLAPLLAIQLNPMPPAAVAGAAGIVATSRNGLKALAQSGALEAARALPIFTVGPATAKLAQDLGFATIVSGPGTAVELLPIIAAHPTARTGPLVHLAGDHLAYDLKGKLAAQGITLTPIPAYKSVAAKTLPDNVQTLLATGALDAVILMSPRSAATWVGLLSALPVKPKLTKLTHICLSQAVADKLQGLAGLTSVIAERPNADEIIIQVYRLAGPAKTG
ncbi:MAG: uroporphyrinogen-III synthase [Hyphomicrobium sp.]